MSEVSNICLSGNNSTQQATAQPSEMCIQVFTSSLFGNIRTAGTSDNPLFCLADVCRALGLQQKHVIERLDKGTVSNGPLSTAGGIQQANFINEDGLYDVILDSRKPEARKFRKWITSEVLPSIRKHGAYATQITIESIIANPESGIKLLQALQKEQAERKRLAQENAEKQALIETKQATIALQEEEIKKAAPKVEYYDKTLQSVNTLTITQIAKSLGMQARTLNEKLRECGVQFRQSGMWMLCAAFAGLGLTCMRTSTFTHNDNTTGTRSYTVWTELGRRFICALIDCGYNVKEALKTIK